MNAAEQELLEAFARRERAVPEAVRGGGVALAELALSDPVHDGRAPGEAPAPRSADAPGDLEELRGRAEEMASRGLLQRVPREDTAADAYALTEDGRLALAGPLDLTLYTRPGCHLCEEAKGQIAPLVRRAGARLREVNIDDDALLRQRYDVEIPVLFLGDRKIAKHRVDLRQFQRQLQEAARGGRH